MVIEQHFALRAGWLRLGLLTWRPIVDPGIASSGGEVPVLSVHRYARLLVLDLGERGLRAPS